ncbi:MAG: malonyl CoA-acyl carrier protein transacylase [Micavibrio sp.]|nr:MAG: malonyl CoA-acyl carrier protein transacylase [Micavibrio sp.]
MSIAFVFPGQGSQAVDMGKDLFETFAEARAVFEEIDESLSQNLSKIIFEGPEKDLNLTENTQPALMAVSMAVVAVLQKQGGIDIASTCSFVAGHSLGEYTALTAIGALKLSDTARLLKLRGQAMQKAVPIGTGAMAAILGLEMEDVESIAKEAAGDEICECANDNSPGQIVVSGHKSAVERAVALASEKGAKRALILPVSVPSHSSLMQPAAEIMQAALAEADMIAPPIPVVCNVTAQDENDTDRIRRLLVDQMTNRVRWRESVLWMRDQGVTDMVEIGAGKVLSGLARRIDKEITCENVSTPEGVESLIEKLNNG